MRSSRAGFSVVELLVAMSVLAALTSLIVPALQQVRESSRLVTCKSRLQQIGTAIHGYVSMHQSLPPIAPGMDRQRNRSNDNSAPHLALLSWLEQSALARDISEFQPLGVATRPAEVQHSRLRALVTTPVPVFRCPSDGGPGLNNMVFCIGADAVAQVEPRSGYWGQGPFPLIESLPIAQIHDGLSNTAAVSERLCGSQDPTDFDRRRDAWYSGIESVSVAGGGWPVSNQDLLQVCDAARPAAPFIHAHAAWSWAYGRFDGGCYNHVVPPNSRHQDCSTRTHSVVPQPTLHGIFKASSNHRGGVNQLMLDGSVRFVSDAISPRVYAAIATRSGGEPVGSSEF